MKKRGEVIATYISSALLIASLILSRQTYLKGKIKEDNDLPKEPTKQYFTKINKDIIKGKAELIYQDYIENEFNTVLPVKEEIETNKVEKRFNFAYINNDTIASNRRLKTEYKLEKYQKVIIIEEDNNKYFIEYINNDNISETGYVLKKDITILPDTFIEVDISSQTVKMYMDAKLVLESPVVTGMKGVTPTRLGYHEIYEMKEHTFLKGYNANGTLRYSRFVDYWIGFDIENRIGLHDAEYHHDEDIDVYHGWRTKEEFNKETYLEHGSLGCVNSLNETAKIIYENSEVGTKVLVHK